MDNAARALIMAASVILGVMLLYVFVYVFRAGASVDEAYDEMQIERELRLDSAKFDVYDRQDNTIMDILSVINLAYNTNEDYDYDSAKAVEVVIHIGNTYFAIPRVELTGNLKKAFGRNKILNRGASINSVGEIQSTYDLADKTLKELEITGLAPNTTDAKTDKLSTTKLGRRKILNADGSEKKNVYGETLYRNNVTIYKYIFKSKCVCGKHKTGFSYNMTAGIGRIVKIEFEAEYNKKEWEGLE